jgi:hypothetical protein
MGLDAKGSKLNMPDINEDQQFVPPDFGALRREADSARSAAILGTPLVRPFEDMVHPEVKRYLRYFQFGHLPAHLAVVSRPFCDMAYDLASRYTGPQLIVTLRSLLRAKDDAVRCALDERTAQLEPRPARFAAVDDVAQTAAAVLEAHEAGGN